MYLHSPLKKIRVTQRYGENLIPEKKWYGARGHRGIDFGAPIGTPIYAACDGQVFIKDKGAKGLGKHIILRSKELGLQIRYGHLSDWEVGNGVNVKRGQVIGYTGNTGYSTGPHLHLETEIIHWHENGSGPYAGDPAGKNADWPVNPEIYLSPRVVRLPADFGYDIEPVSVKEFAKTFLWILRQPGLWSEIGLRGYRALRWGRWDLGTIRDTAMFPVWSKMTKMEYEF